MKDINIISLDMEYNQPSNSIIQVGIAVGNLATGDILETYSSYIFQDELINPRITKLTGIAQEDVDLGDNIEWVYEHIKSLHKEFECFRNPLTWGGGDSNDLRLALDIDEKSEENYLFGRRWIDVKTLFVSHCLAKDIKTQSGLAKSMSRLGLKFEGKKHNALDDAINTFKIYMELLERMEDI